MKLATYRRLSKLLKAGKLKNLERELAPFLVENDPDARFLNVHFSTTLSGEETDARLVSELHKLSAELHPPSLRELAWRYRHGDDVPKDYAKFKDLLATAAILGNETAKRDLAVVLEIDLDYSGLAMRFPEH
ncbi:MAG: hypothetical protein EOP83_33005 [Verrucomicrobiaceae bacterium]|nr:MAG: hypothetical protein EOP83_33005 [Verrucomicrobiaceae bacterium]